MELLRCCHDAAFPGEACGDSAQRHITPSRLHCISPPPQQLAPDQQSCSGSHHGGEEPEVSSDRTSSTAAAVMLEALAPPEVLPCRGGYLVIKRQRSHSAVHHSALGPISRPFSRATLHSLTQQPAQQPPPLLPTPPSATSLPTPASHLPPVWGPLPHSNQQLQPHSSPVMQQLMAALEVLAGQQAAAQQLPEHQRAPATLDPPSPLLMTSTAATPVHSLGCQQGPQRGMSPHPSTPLAGAEAPRVLRPSPIRPGPLQHAVQHPGPMQPLATPLQPAPAGAVDGLAVRSELLQVVQQRARVRDLLLQLALQRRVAQLMQALQSE